MAKEMERIKRKKETLKSCMNTETQLLILEHYFGTILDDIKTRSRQDRTLSRSIDIFNQWTTCDAVQHVSIHRY